MRKTAQPTTTMSRYNSNNGGSSNGGDNDYSDDITLKAQQYTTLAFEPTRLGQSEHDQYGTSFIANFDNTRILDGIVFQREDKPGTWKIFSANKFFHMNPENGLVYENYDEDEGYSGEMSAQDILEHPRIAGFTENFGGEDYLYKPVGVVVEASGDLVVDDDVLGSDDAETARTEGYIPVGSSSMLLNNKSWVRTFAKKLSQTGDDIINDNGEYGEDADNPKNDPHDWLTTSDPELRTELEGREMEFWVTEETREWDDGETTTFEVPNLLDVKTDNFITIDNGVESDDDENSEKAAATDGGTTTQDSTESDTESPETTDSPDTDDDDGLPDGVPDALDGVLNYMAKRNKTDADQIREFAGDEVDDPDAVDWEAAAEVAEERA